MTVEICRGDTAALPSCDRAAELLPIADSDPLTLACTDGDMNAAYRVLRAIMDYGYEHESPSRVRLICADETAYKGIFLPMEYVVCRRKAQARGLRKNDRKRCFRSFLYYK